MDNSASLLPGRNPTGSPTFGGEAFLPNIGTSSGANPYLPQPNLPANAPPSNPYNASSVPTFGANTGGYTSSLNLGAPSGTNPVSGVGDITGRQQGRTLGELQSLYGEGLGALMYQFLQSGAGYNQQAINNLLASLQPGVERGTESLVNQFSTSGNRFGSGAQIGVGDYLSQVNLNEGEIVSQMYTQAVDRYMAALTGADTQSLQFKEFSMSQPGVFDDIIAALGALKPGAPNSIPQNPQPNVPSVPSGGGADTSIPGYPAGVPIPGFNDISQITGSQDLSSLIGSFAFAG